MNVRYDFTADFLLENMPELTGELRAFFEAMSHYDFHIASLDGKDWTTSYNDGAAIHMDARGGTFLEVLERLIESFVTKQ